MPNNKYPESADKLAKELRKIFDDDDFVMMIFSCAYTEERILKVLDFIANSDEVTDETVTCFALDLGE